MGMAMLAAVAALPVVLVFRASRRPAARAFAIAAVASPACTLLLGLLLSEIRYGGSGGRGLNTRVFTEFFIGASLLLFFVGFWVLSHRFLIRRAAKASAASAAPRSAS